MTTVSAAGVDHYGHLLYCWCVRSMIRVLESVGSSNNALIVRGLMGMQSVLDMNYAFHG